MGIRRLFSRREGATPSRGGRDAWVIVGIGNPGSGYAGNRHNVGAWAVSRLARQLGVELRNSKLAGVAEVSLDGQSALLVRPRTYVNESGRAVAEILRRDGIAPQRLVVIYDELDLAVGQVRLRGKGGAGGHNGMKSIIGAIGTQDFARVRVGIGRPAPGGVPTHDPDEVARYVLANPPPDERAALEQAAGRAAEAAEAIVRDGIEPAMNRYNRG